MLALYTAPVPVYVVESALGSIMPLRFIALLQGGSACQDTLCDAAQLVIGLEICRVSPSCKNPCSLEKAAAYLPALMRTDAAQANPGVSAKLI